MSGTPELPALLFLGVEIHHIHRGRELAQKEVHFKFEVRKDISATEVIAAVLAQIWDKEANQDHCHENESPVIICNTCHKIDRVYQVYNIKPTDSDQTNFSKTDVSNRETYALTAGAAICQLQKMKKKKRNFTYYFQNKCEFLYKSAPDVVFNNKNRGLDIVIRICFNDLMMEGENNQLGSMFFIQAVGAYVVMKQEIIQLIDEINSHHTQNPEHVLNIRWITLKTEMNRILKIPHYIRAVEVFRDLNRQNDSGWWHFRRKNLKRFLPFFLFYFGFMILAIVMMKLTG